MAKIKQQVQELEETKSGDVPTVSADFFDRGNEDYEPLYSTKLIDGSNVLAAEIFGSADNYRRFISLAAQNLNAEVAAKNKPFFNKEAVQGFISDQLVPWRFKPTPYPSGYDSIFTGPTILLLNKLTRLERKHSPDELFTEEQQEKILECLMGGIGLDGVLFQGNTHLSLTFPPTPAVFNKLLTPDEIDTIACLVVAVQDMRHRLSGFRLYVSGYSVEQLLTPMNTDAIKSWQHGEKTGAIIRTSILHHFFTTTVPYHIRKDLIDESLVGGKLNTLSSDVQNLSRELRETTTLFAQGYEPLNKVLTAITKLISKLMEYSCKLAAEVELYFRFLSQIGLTFEDFVNENKARVADSGVPW